MPISRDTGERPESTSGVDWVADAWKSNGVGAPTKSRCRPLPSHSSWGARPKATSSGGDQVAVAGVRSESLIRFVPAATQAIATLLPNAPTSHARSFEFQPSGIHDPVQSGFWLVTSS